MSKITIITKATEKKTNESNRIFEYIMIFVTGSLIGTCQESGKHVRILLRRYPVFHTIIIVFYYPSKSNKRDRVQIHMRQCINKGFLTPGTIFKL